MKKLPLTVILTVVSTAQSSLVTAEISRPTEKSADFHQQSAPARLAANPAITDPFKHAAKVERLSAIKLIVQPQPGVSDFQDCGVCIARPGHYRTDEKVLVIAFLVPWTGRRLAESTDRSDFIHVPRSAGPFALKLRVRGDY